VRRAVGGDGAARRHERLRGDVSADDVMRRVVQLRRAELVI
jgi:hypothetical protein